MMIMMMIMSSIDDDEIPFGLGIVVIIIFPLILECGA